MNTTVFVSQLKEKTQEEIKSEIKNHLFVNVGLGSYQEEYHEAIENAMSSRLCDLEEVIDIEKYK